MDAFDFLIAGPSQILLSKHSLSFNNVMIIQTSARSGAPIVELASGLCLPINIMLFSSYEGCSNMNASSFIASSFITFLKYMLRQNGKRFYKGLYVTFKLAPDLKKNTVYFSSYSPLNEGHVSILTNSMLRIYSSDIDERITLR